MAVEIEQLLVGRMAVFCYIVSCSETNTALVIDPGGDEDRVAGRVKEKKLDLKYIVNTHFHGDHSCGNLRMKEITGAEILIHEMDAPFLLEPAAVELMAKLGFKPSPPADRTVKDGDTIELGRLSIAVLHTPGHSPGGMCLLVEDNLFTGDTLFVGGIGRTDLPASSHTDFMKSIREKLLVLPDETVVWPGHNYGPNPSSTIGLEKVANPWLRRLV